MKVWEVTECNKERGNEKMEMSVVEDWDSEIVELKTGETEREVDGKE